MNGFTKMIFSVLIGVNILIVAISGTVELINVFTYSSMLKINLDTAVKAGCDYFNQETYKSLDGNNFGNMDAILNKDGGVAVSGIFYLGNNAIDIYNNLYDDNVGFEEFKRMTSSDGRYFHQIWSSLAQINRNVADFSHSTGLYDVDNLVTPSNIGVSYLDKTAVTKIIKWNIASLVSQGSSENVIYKDGKNLININGFEVDIDSLRVNIDYEAVPVNSDRFELLTNLDKDIMYDNANGDPERETVCIAKISYSIDIRYVGITPIKNIVEFYSDYRVEGLNNNSPARAQETINSNFDRYSSYVYFYVIR